MRETGTHKTEAYRDCIDRIVRKQKAYRDACFNANRLAEMIGVEGYELSRILKRAFGMSFTDMVNGLRTEDAMRYLKDTRLKGCTIDDIGAMAGFGNRQTFHEEFKKRTGSTPAQYRTSNTYKPPTK